MSTQQDQTTTNKTKNSFISILTQPIEWLTMLTRHLNPSFIAGIFIIYGIGQGFSVSFFKLVSDYYWKDIQKIQPSTVQLYVGIYFIPWILKPIWGILTDAFPLLGYRRRPYFILAGVVGLVSALVVAVKGKLAAVAALMCFLGVFASLAIAGVTIDACIARKSIEVPRLAPDLQSFCGLCSGSGALIGYLVSGFFVHHLGPQGSFGLMAVFPALTIVLGFVIYEKKANGLHNEKKQGAMKNAGMIIRSMYKTIKYPQAWKPSLYMFLSLSLNVTTHEGHFYWYTDSKAGPAFSQEFVGVIYAIGAVASIIGVLIYHKYLKNYTFRSLVFYAQLLYAVSGVLDLIFVLRWNLKIGIPDYVFVVLEETAVRITGKIRWMPMMVLSAKLCPLGIEGTFFALLMCIDSIGALISKWGGGLLLHVLHITRSDFNNLWLAVLIRDILRFVTLVLVFLIPNVGPYEGLLPSEMDKRDGIVDEQTLELVPIHAKVEV
ncbi:probable folate-biopterin transporter 6 [Vicia villosa]|uniref:probable folate-biopterin transporter 6 n=1 Tax=Vicia villosa TaxID=3911 RepID=UPI00273C49CF|nr:probable folate-biopterin transporter 6 [Vicia villosa]